MIPPEKNVVRRVGKPTLYERGRHFKLGAKPSRAPAPRPGRPTTSPNRWRCGWASPVGSLYGPVADLAVDIEGRLVLSAGGKSFVLGARTGNHLPAGAPEMPEFAAEPGDSASLVLERSLLAWPAPFEINVVGLGGTKTTWQRHVYYRLSWVKASGARLSMLWAGEQPFYGVDLWGAPGSFLTTVEIR